MLMSGKCGFSLNDDIRSTGLISVVTPGKLSSKNFGTWVGSASSLSKFDDGMKSVQVNDPSCEIVSK